MNARLSHVKEHYQHIIYLKVNGIGFKVISELVIIAKTLSGKNILSSAFIYKGKHRVMKMTWSLKLFTDWTQLQTTPSSFYFLGEVQ